MGGGPAAKFMPFSRCRLCIRAPQPKPKPSPPQFAYVHQNQSHHHHSLLTCTKTKITTVCLHCMHHNQNHHRLQGAPKLKPPPQGLSPKPPPQFAWMQQLRNHSEYHHHHSSSFYKLEALISAYWLMPQSCKFVSKWILSIQMFSDSADKPSKTRLHNTSQPRRERICNCWHVTVSIFGPV